MSHIEEGKTSLVFNELPPLLRQKNEEAIAQHRCIKLLQQAVLLVAKRYDGEVQPYYVTYYGEKLSANTGLALHIPVRAGKPAGEALPRGIGLVIDEETGRLTFRGDPWDVDERFYQHIQHAIVQEYAALAHATALRQMNYQVSMQRVEDQIMITGGSYVA